MVVIASPPPPRRPRPLFHTLPAGTGLIRLFRPTDHGATAASFRFYGPLLRFDHHRGDGASDRPGCDPGRGIYYAARTLSGYVVEEAIALYERGADALDCPSDRVRRLDDAAIRSHLLAIADRHNHVLGT